MKRVFAKFFFVFSAAFCLSISGGLTRAATPSGTPPADEIIGKLLDWLEARHDKNELFTYKQITDMEKLNGDGEVEERENLLYQSEIVEGYNFERLIQKNGKPLTQEEQKEQKEREKEFHKHVQKRKENGKEGPKRLREIADRFKFEVLGKETIRGRSAFVVSFEPDAIKDLQEKEDEDRFINALKGSLWVDELEFAIVKAKALLIRQINFGMGLLAYFKKLDLEHEWMRDPDGHWRSAASKTYMWGRSLIFKPIRFREKSKYFDFKKAK
jgi:hypothetical protein